MEEGNESGEWVLAGEEARASAQDTGVGGSGCAIIIISKEQRCCKFQQESIILLPLHSSSPLCVLSLPCALPVLMRQCPRNRLLSCAPSSWPPGSCLSGQCSSWSYSCTWFLVYYTPGFCICQEQSLLVGRVCDGGWWGGEIVWWCPDRLGHSLHGHNYGSTSSPASTSILHSPWPLLVPSSIVSFLQSPFPFPLHVLLIQLLINSRSYQWGRLLCGSRYSYIEVLFGYIVIVLDTL